MRILNLDFDIKNILLYYVIKHSYVVTKTILKGWISDQVYLLILVNFLVPGSGSRKAKSMRIHADPKH
jgi:hypothetical protein